MNKISAKLRDKSGATLLIVLAFMIFCLFVGGSVLVAASVSGSRIQSLNADRQEGMNQRNIASLLAEELKVPGVEKLNLKVSKNTVTKTHYVYAEGGDTVRDGVPVTTQTLEFEAGALPEGEEYTPLQQLLFEAAIRQYLLSENGGDTSGYQLSFKNFTLLGGRTVTNTSQLYGTDLEHLTVTDPRGKTIEMKMTCDPKTCSAALTFAENPQVNIYMKNTSDMEMTRRLFQRKQKDSNVAYYMIQTLSETVDLAWNEPSVQKGSGTD